MLRVFVIFVFTLPSIASADEIFDHKNASFDSHRTTVSDGIMNRSVHDSVRTTERLPSIWLADMFYQAMYNFTVQRNVGTLECQKQTDMYIRHLKNSSYWAVKMYESWGRYPNGLLTGSTHQMGLYEECIDVHIPVQGKYCITAVKLGTALNKSFELHKKDDVDIYGHAWNEILGYVDYDDQYPRNEVKIGMCIPGSCTAENLEISLQNALDAIFVPHHVQPTVQVQPILCSTNEHMYPKDTGYYVTTTIICLIFSICFISTLYHLTTLVRNEDGEKKSALQGYVNWFSIIHNGRNLIKYDKNNDLNIFNGFKALVMIMVIFGHKYLYYTMNPISYTMPIEKIYKIGPDILLTSMNIVDPFFYMTGYLMFVITKPLLKKNRTSWIQIPMIITYKYLRMMPAYGTMMLLTVYIIPYINNGPFWASIMLPEADKCKNYWWANLLAVSNFVDFDNQCLVVGWYMSCLIQFLVIGTIVIYVHVKNHKVGIVVLSALLFKSFIIPFVLTYTTRSYGIVRVMYSFLKKPSNSYELENLYAPFYMRSIPFYVGLLIGIVVEELKKRKIKWSKSLVYIWTFVIFVVCMWVQFYSVAFYKRHRPYNVIEQSVYAVLSHCTWTAMLSWITICHSTSGCGPIEKVLNNQFMSILGRLSYAVYLVNITVIMTIEARQTTSIVPTTESSIDGWIVAVFRSYITGLLLFLFVEAPFNTIIKNLFFGSKTDSTKGLNDKVNMKREISNVENLQCVSRL